jgi:hypothetical protein
MQLDDLESAWKQLKLSNAMHSLDSNKILAIIEIAEHADRNRFQRVLINLMIGVVITIFCQQG